MATVHSSNTIPDATPVNASPLLPEIDALLDRFDTTGGYLILRTQDGQKICRFGDAPPCALLSALDTGSAA